MYATRSSLKLLPVYQVTRCHITEHRKVKDNLLDRYHETMPLYLVDQSSAISVDSDEPSNTKVAPELRKLNGVHLEEFHSNRPQGLIYSLMQAQSRPRDRFIHF